MSKVFRGRWVERCAVFVLQQFFSMSIFRGMAPRREQVATLQMDDKGTRSPSRHTNHPPGDGNILRQPVVSPILSPEQFWYRVLDWFLDQVTLIVESSGFDHRAENSNRKYANAAVVKIGSKRRVDLSKNQYPSTTQQRVLLRCSMSPTRGPSIRN